MGSIAGSVGDTITISHKVVVPREVPTAPETYQITFYELADGRGWVHDFNDERCCDRMLTLAKAVDVVGIKVANISVVHILVVLFLISSGCACSISRSFHDHFVMPSWCV